MRTVRDFLSQMNAMVLSRPRLLLGFLCSGFMLAFGVLTASLPGILVGLGATVGFVVLASFMLAVSRAAEAARRARDE